MTNRKEVSIMEITGIKIKKIETDNKMKAIASITIDDCFAVHDIKVIQNEDKVFVDLTGKSNGRGAYIKKDIEVLERAIKNKNLERALEIKIDDSLYENLRKIIKEDINE